MKVAIIGANGFVGTRLVEYLHLGDFGVCCAPVVRRPAALAPVCRFDVPWRLGDALDEESLSRALEGCEAVVHVALGDPRQIEQMPAVLCAAARRQNLRRVVYLSSASVHGQAPAPGTDEASALHTGQALAYNDAKVRAERSFFQACKTHDLDGFALRPGVVLGPRSRWITDLAKDLREGRAWLHGDGSAVLNSIHVDNLCHAIVQCLRAPAAAAGVYLVGDPEPVTWRDLALGMARGLGVPEGRIHRVEKLPVFEQGAAQRIRESMTGPFAQRLLPLVPGSLKQGVKKLLAPSPSSPNAWSLPQAPGPRFTQELVLLQQCRWRLPHTLAETRLGYSPSLGFAEGLALNLRWLAFTEGRPC